MNHICNLCISDNNNICPFHHTNPLLMPHRWTNICLFILFIIAWANGASPDYNKDHTLICSQVSQKKLQRNLSELWNILILHALDRYTFLALCPIIFIFQVMILCTYLRNQKLMIRPGNIFFGVMVIQTLLNLLLFIFAIYDTVNDLYKPMPHNFVPFCSITGFIQAFLSILHFLYISLFLVYTIFLFRFSLKKKSEKFWKLLNFVVILGCLILTIFFYFLDFIGLTMYGICGLTPTRLDRYNITLSVFEICFAIMFSLTGAFTYSYFKKHMPGGEVFRRKKMKQSRIIFFYVVGFSTFYFATGLMDLLININCLDTSPVSGITILATIINLIRLAEFMFMIFLILIQDNFRRKFKKMIKQLFQREVTVDRSISLTTQQDQTIQRQIELEQLAFDEKLLKIKEKKNQIDLLLVSQIYTIISGVYIANYQYNKQQEEITQVRSIHFQESIQFCLSQKSILNYEKQDRGMLQLTALSCDMILYAPRIFRKLLELDNIHNVYQSFNIIDNVKKIWNLAEGDGGKSGQFFFFSSDNKFVLKTITQQQFQFLKENIQYFYEFYRKNPKSLLAKIYGLYIIKGDQIQRTYRIVLMKNIIGCPRTQVLRIFDMKGSKYDRQVIKDISQESLISKVTLKDIDFMNYEGKINIQEDKTYQLRQILRKDSIFLKQLNLIDYSLLLVRVTWKNPPKNQNFWTEFQRMKDICNTDEYYHIGIIDYMQKWDLQKKGEKWWKNFIGKKQVSAAEPNYYQKRFIQFIDEIVAVLAMNDKQKSEYQQKSISNRSGQKKKTKKKQKKTSDSEDMKAPVNRDLPDSMEEEQLQGQKQQHEEHKDSENP